MAPMPRPPRLGCACWCWIVYPVHHPSSIARSKHRGGVAPVRSELLRAMLTLVVPGSAKPEANLEIGRGETGTPAPVSRGRDRVNENGDSGCRSRRARRKHGAILRRCHSHASGGPVCSCSLGFRELIVIPLEMSCWLGCAGLRSMNGCFRSRGMCLSSFRTYVRTVNYCVVYIVCGCGQFKDTRVIGGERVRPSPFTSMYARAEARVVPLAGC
ncbi:uncharacterized protein P884DRAFT_257588 [Thermothelomyces heterothallicus CBS 202.75]|uniref:uncharacterized protein n=1 Tax=Thermothelomyces heterothallicus CBS 202.75 TaxID=1149848 RepID=UPI003743A881